jgi:predicted RNase H-like nuclease (RuvC/YqgF family)
MGSSLNPPPSTLNQAQVKKRHEEMLEMLQEQESQIERLRGERDEIEPILSGLKRDIERLEASRERCDEIIIRP